MSRKTIPTKTLLIAAAAFVGAPLAQPELNEAWTLPVKVCSIDTGAAHSAEMDSVIAANGGPDANGWMTIFNGKGDAGWFNNCRTHSQNDPQGAIFRVDTVRRALYAQQRGTGVGGLFTTKKKFAHYEIMFDWWPQYGNDGGVFNRTTIAGRAYQVVLDYMANSAIYGMWSEGGFPTRDNGSGTRNFRPWSYVGNSEPFTTGANGMTTPQSGGDTTYNIQNGQMIGAGGNGGNSSNWTYQTALTTNPEAAGIGCAATGCVATDLRRLWNKNGWNQGRIIYAGGLSTTQPPNRDLPGDKIRMRSYTRIYYPLTNPDGPYVAPIPGVSDTARWVPVLADSMVLTATEAAQAPASWLGFQIHSGDGRYVDVSEGGRGTWYRNIRIRELDSTGVPVAVSISPNRNKSVRYDMRVSAFGVLTGSMDLDHVVTARDLNGRILLRTYGDAGQNLRYELPRHNGIMVVQIATSRGIQTLRANGISSR